MTSRVDLGEAAGMVLSGHPLVMRISFDPGSISFKLQIRPDKTVLVRFVSSDEIYLGEHGDDDYNGHRYA